MALKELRIKTTGQTDRQTTGQPDEPVKRLSLYKKQALQRRYNQVIEKLNEVWRDGVDVTKPWVNEMVGLYQQLRDGGVEITTKEKWEGFGIV